MKDAALNRWDGVRHTLFPITGIGRSAVAGCQFPDAIPGGNSGLRSHSRTANRIAPVEFSSEASRRSSSIVCRRSLAAPAKDGSAYNPPCQRTPRTATPIKQRALAPGYGSNLLPLRLAFSTQSADAVFHACGIVKEPLRLAFACQPGVSPSLFGPCAPPKLNLTVFGRELPSPTRQKRTDAHGSGHGPFTRVTVCRSTTGNQPSALLSLGSSRVLRRGFIPPACLASALQSVALSPRCDPRCWSG